jgi:hypothetical protein
MRKLLLLIAVFLPSLASAQGVPWIITVLGPQGGLKVGATITVCGYPAVGGFPCTNTVTVYSDLGLSVPLNPPLKTDSFGTLQFFIPVGIYAYTVTGAGITSPQGPYAFSAQGNLVALPQVLLSANTTAVTVTGSAAQYINLTSFTFPANVLNGLGKTFRITSYGLLNAGVGGTRGWPTPLFGGQHVINWAGFFNITDTGTHNWREMTTCTVTTVGVSGAVKCWTDITEELTVAVPNAVHVNVEPGTAFGIGDLTAPITFTQQMNWVDQNVSNTITQYAMFVEQLN